MPARETASVVVASPRISNVWIFADGEGHRFLVDTGHRLERSALASSLRAAGIERGGLTAVLLTHRHSDHAGNAAWVREHWRCPVICHPDDARTLSGMEPASKLARRGATPIHETLCRVEDRFPARSPVDDVLADGESRWGIEVISAKGHTAGSVLLLHAASRTLFTGDALLSGAPVQRFIAKLTLAIPAYSEDVDACHGAVLGFLEQRRSIETLCTGHGPLLRRRVPALLRRLLASHRAPTGKRRREC